jgi:hypothetical protein
MSSRKDEGQTHKSSTPLPESTSDRITKEDLAYHQRVFSEFRDAIGAEQQAIQRAGRARAAFESWAAHLHELYALNPQYGEGVKEDGTIDRILEDPPPRDA